MLSGGYTGNAWYSSHDERGVTDVMRDAMQDWIQEMLNTRIQPADKSDRISQLRRLNGFYIAVCEIQGLFGRSMACSLNVMLCYGHLADISTQSRLQASRTIPMVVLTGSHTHTRCTHPSLRLAALNTDHNSINLS